MKQYLEDLESRIDLSVESELNQQWLDFLDGKCPTPFFRPSRRKAVPAGIEWPRILINDAIGDLEQMLLRELCESSKLIAQGGGKVHAIRSNYGTGILPSLFGAENFFMEDKFDTLPTTHPLPDGTDGVRRLLDAGVPDLEKGWGGRVFETAAFYQEVLKDYPKLKSVIRIYHPDLQGPADVAEMLWGSDMFFGFYDSPELVRAFLELITETYTRFMRRWEELVPPPTDFCCHWGFAHRGRLVIRNDSGVNLSPELYSEFILPVDRKLMQHFGGGVVHFCGRGDHYIESLCSAPELTGIQLSQPHLNDMEKIYRNTVDRDIPLFSLALSAAEEAVNKGRDLRGRVHCD